MARRRQQPALSIVTAPNGARFTVAADVAPRWQAFLNDPAWAEAGFRFEAKQSGGFADRNIRGTNIRSQHAHGRAVDLNWTSNPRGSKAPRGADPATIMPRDLAQRLADKHGMIWGGTWKNPDPMHFELRRDSPVPMEARSLVAAAGHQIQPATRDEISTVEIPPEFRTGLAPATPEEPEIAGSDVGPLGPIGDAGRFAESRIAPPAPDEMQVPAGIAVGGLPSPDTLPQASFDVASAPTELPQVGPQLSSSPPQQAPAGDGLFGEGGGGRFKMPAFKNLVTIPQFEDPGAALAALDPTAEDRPVNIAPRRVPPAPPLTPSHLPVADFFGSQQRKRRQQQFG